MLTSFKFNHMVCLVTGRVNDRTAETGAHLEHCKQHGSLCIHGRCKLMWNSNVPSLNT